MESCGKREAITRYKEADQKATGCIYEIRCVKNGRCWVRNDPSMRGAESKFIFAQKVGSCPVPSMLADWKSFGKDAFEFRVLETLDKKEAQTPRDFREDLRTLEELWLEKYDKELLYLR